MDFYEETRTLERKEIWSSPTQVVNERPRSEDGRWVSEERYWAEYYEHPDFNYEWNNGYLEEKGVSRQVTVWFYDWFSLLIKRFLKSTDLGQTTALETGFRFTLPSGKVQVRKPDLGVVLKSNPVPLQGHENSYRGIFDLCVEAISDSNRTEVERDTIHKKKEYAQAGSKEFYLLDGWGSNKEVEAERQRAEAERQRAEAERQRAEQMEAELAQERQRAEAERQRAERMAALLQKLGLSLEEAEG